MIGDHHTADKLRLLREMLFARRFEERCYEAYVERKIGGAPPLYRPGSMLLWRDGGGATTVPHTITA